MKKALLQMQHFVKEINRALAPPAVTPHHQILYCCALLELLV
jgi:hypothetical protein